MVSIANKLNIVAGNKVVVPGCEPLSAISSPTLAASLRCNNAYVDLAVALKAIPGSTVEYALNGGFGRILQWFVLPPYKVNCPCNPKIDYYQILRDIPPIEEETEEVSCRFLDMQFCEIGKDSDNYQYTVPGSEMGATTGILRWPPPWSAK